MTPDLAELAELAAARARLDDHELALIDRCRHGGATWAQVAAALGLGSRQAAEQRRQRLLAARRARRESLDLAYAERIAALRAAVVALSRWIDTDRRWDGRFRRAALVRATVATALDAEPGSLHTLASHVAADLADAGPDRLPAPVRAAAAELETRLST
ncbi:hypothetical protein [Micromonospora endolithica]|uniref:Uncharacterized protein n=1 Tax=Micromonospora endolithica TaxID=230091 RepID=A0A3A9ZAR6_9ACTN|nr:hypothetical protein [Micromonospora endolithica]RKN45403.1 hypothetical protein D7223_17510 [Micromonospora endolithica]TWJ22885.1 hypothetical protein JD76_03008 [Micromonospora endolithica]